MGKVVIDPGHGGTDPGARDAAGRPEKESNLRVALKVEALLRRQGIDVLMTRRDDSSVSLPARCKMSDDWGADVYLSLHADAGAPTARGHHAIHSIHSRPGKGGAKLARLIVDEVTRATGRQPMSYGDRGVWSRKSDRNPSKDWYAVIRGTRASAVILERGFLTNPQDAALMFDDADLDRQAEGIARGVCAYFGVPFRAPTPQPQPAPQVGASPALAQPGAKLNVARCRPQDVDVVVTPPARLSEIVRSYVGPVARASNANLYVVAEGRPLGLLWQGGKSVSLYPWPWPVLAIYKDGTARVLTDGWRQEDLASPALSCAVAGAPLLVRDGKPLDIPSAMKAAGIDSGIRPGERIPRTAVGIDAGGLIVHAVTEAATLAELAAGMAAAGCVVALNLDGGGSTGLVEGGKLVAGSDVRRLPCALIIREVVRPEPVPSPPACRVEVRDANGMLRWSGPGEVRDGAAWAPVRAVTEALGARVAWDAGSRTVRISRPEGDDATAVTRPVAGEIIEED